MAIKLIPEEAKYIIDKLSNDSWWVAKSIISKINTDIEDKLKNKNCEHEEGEYVGHKTCCKKCGSFFKEGCKEDWQLEVTQPAGHSTKGKRKSHKNRRVKQATPIQSCIPL